MNKKLIFIIFMTSLLRPADKLELWLGNTVKTKVADHSDLYFYQLLSFDKFNDFYYYLIDSAIYFDIEKKYYIAPTMRLSYARSDGKWLREVTPFVEFSGSMTLEKPAKLFYRIIPMYRILENRNNRESIRAKVGFSYLFKNKYNAYVAEELFYNYNGFNTMDEARSICGVNLKLDKHIDIDASIMREDFKNSTTTWRGAYVLDITLGMRF